MNDKDKQEFEKWFKDIWAMPDDFDEGHTIKPEHEWPMKRSQANAWQAALEYERNISEKVFDLFNKNIDVLGDEIYKLQAEIKKLREALEFYADEKNMVSLTGLPFGRRAREALKEVGENER
jgi:hypothetical protein